MTSKTKLIKKPRLWRVVDEELMTTAIVKADSVKQVIEKLYKAVGAESWGLSCGPQHVQEIVFDKNGVSVL